MFANEILLQTDSSEGLFYSNFNCYNKLTCQTIYSLKTLINSYIKVQIRELKFTGWKSSSCFYGGISFHETDTNNKMKYKEILSLCDNYLNSKKEQKENVAQNMVVIYTSTTNEVKLVAYHLNSDRFGAGLFLSTTNCKGIFVNPCINVVFPNIFRKKLLHYQYYENQFKCLTYQVGLQYFITRLTFKAKKEGCKKVYNMMQNDPSCCGATLSYLEFNRISKYTSSLFNKRQIGNQIYFLSKIEGNSSQFLQKESFPCAESFDYVAGFSKTRSIMTHRHWYRGLNIYLFESSNFQTIFKFHVKISLFNQIQKVSDSFWLRMEPFSETLSILTFRYLKCTKSTQLQLPIGSSQLFPKDQGEICLREPIKGIIRKNTVLELSLTGKFTCGNCSIGTVKLQSLLCLQFTKIYLLFTCTFCTRSRC